MNISDYKGVMVLAEQKNGHIHSITYELLHRGRDLADKLGVDLSCAVLGYGVEDLDGLIRRGADIVFYMENRRLEHFLPNIYTGSLVKLINETKPEIIIAAATTAGRTVMPMAAARLGTGLTADCTLLDIDPQEKVLLQTRPAIGGNIMATIKTPHSRPQMATVRPKSCRQAEENPDRQGQIIPLNFAETTFSSPERFIEFIKDTTQDVNIQDADIIVAGGKGLKNRDGFRLVEELAGVMGAGVGASRDVVDLGWATYPHQIGLSGKTVSPKLYIAVGISGKIQHLAGMQTAQYIVAVNKDPEAQIFKVSDFGIVGDAMDVVPELIGAVKKYRENAVRREIHDLQ